MKVDMKGDMTRIFLPHYNLQSRSQWMFNICDTETEENPNHHCPLHFTNYFTRKFHLPRNLHGTSQNLPSISPLPKYRKFSHFRL